MRIVTTLSSLFIASAIVVAGCNTPTPEERNASNAPEASAASAAPDSSEAAKTKAAVARKSNPVAARARAARAATAVARAAETMTPPAKVNHVQPQYPAIAREARVEGSVLLAVDVGTDGKVSDARVIRSVPLLDQAALDAVRQWEYTPMRRGNVAVPTTMTVRVNFTRS